MTEIYASNLNDYGYDPVKGLCSQPAKAKTAEAKPEKNYCQPDNSLPLPQPSFWAELDRNIRDFGNSFLDHGLACSPTPVKSQVCAADGSPHYPSAGVNPLPAGSVDPNTLTINPDDLKSGGKGIDLTWQFNVSNCDGKSAGMKVRVYFSADNLNFQDFFADENGLVSVSLHFDPKAYPTWNPLRADLYYSNPESSTAPAPLQSAIQLYLPRTKDTTVQKTTCDYSSLPVLDGVHSSAGDSVGFGQSARLSITPEDCGYAPAANATDFAVDFKVEGKWLVKDLNNPSAIKFANGAYYLDYAFTKTTGQQYVIAKVTDPRRANATVETQPYGIYVKANAASIDIFADSGNGFMALRPVTLNAGWNSTVPSSNLNYAWTISDPAGGKVTLDQASGKQISFTPAVKGDYAVTLTISGDGLTEPIVKTGLVKIETFAAPQVAIAGDQYPKSGATASYKPVLMSQWRELGPEDSGAACTWNLSHIASGATIVDKKNEAKACGEALTINFPAVSQQTTYSLQVTAAGANQSYIAVPASLMITVNPPVANQSGAAFAAIYDQDGAIPFRPVTFKGTLTGAPDGLALTYKWTVKDSSGNPLPVQPQDGQTTSYTFKANDIYKMAVSVYGDDLTKPLATREETVEIYAFPKPAVKVTVNNDRTVYAGNTVLLSGQLLRSASFPEDAGATYAWKITHREFDPTLGQSQDVVDLDPASAAAQGPDINFKFANSRSYKVTLTATGHNGSDVAYVANSESVFVTAYSPLGAPGISAAKTVGNLGKELTFEISNPDPDVSYTWNFGDNSAPQTGVSVSHKFEKKGELPVTVIAASNSDPTLTIPSQPLWVTIVAADVTIPGIAADPNGKMGDAIPFEVSNPDPSLTYTWNFGDDSKPVGNDNVGAKVTHKFARTGQFPVRVTATSAADPSLSVPSQPWNIYIEPAASGPILTNPIANLEIQNSQGPAPLTVTANAANSYVTTQGATITDYTFIWGDNGNTPDSGPSPVRTHQYLCASASCNYTVQMTITDSNGKKASSQAAVSTWPQ